MTRKYNTCRRPDHFVEGDLVRYCLKLSSSKGHNISAKLLLRWSMPMVIARKAGRNVVLLANPDAGVFVRMAHVSQLNSYVK